MTEDEALADMEKTIVLLCTIFQNDRAGYKKACEAKADEKSMPPKIKQSFVSFALEVFDKGNEEGSNGRH